MTISQRAIAFMSLIACLMGYLTNPASADELQELPAQRNWVELTGIYHSVSNNYGDWKGAEARAGIPVGRNDFFYLDFLAQETFGDSGVYGVVANTHLWNEDWYTHLAVGSGTGDFYFPDVSVAGSVSRKWLPSRQLITTLGGGYTDSKDGHHDFSLLTSVTVYLFDQFIAEGGARITWSNPGSVQTARGFGVLTYGSDRNRFVTLRYEGGKEGYQPIGSTTTIVDFSSNEVSLSWREWVASNWGPVAKVSYYDNPYYSRTGATFGFFYEW